jgi:phage terminase large subunit
MQCTSVFSKNIRAFHEGKQYLINQGSSSSSKTYSLLQLCYLLASRRGYSVSIMSESMAHLKLSAMRDFINILKADGYYDEKNHNKTDNIFWFGEVGFVEFFSAENSGKVHGARRDVLYINECNNVDYETFFQASSRTKVLTMLDYNPVESFWVMEKLIPMLEEKDYALIKSTVVDNQFIPEKSLQDILRRSKVDENYKRVYLLGEVGKLEGVVFSNWTTCKEMPETSKRCLGVDFGFTNDPTAITDIRYSDGKIWLDEITHQTQLMNHDIARIIKQDNASTVSVCDSAEPKSIAELQVAGVRAVAAEKGADSVRNGIDLMKQYPIMVTERSVNLIKELRNYRWKTDKTGKSLGVPIDCFNHQIDSSRYGITYLLGAANKYVPNKVYYPNK